ncbi:helix-turn-helix domain-containing protein [Glutamicibacter sp. JL.03c]|uniref:IclR family transcriptional regulator n=1 Tax=Glutamicibacter sp. JL.03c TaxID=2984842 RepID=UPI0021F7B58E|nr:helix-turn-helix domain-containing protein [Glutamicibacter sp. JL.03c]UYQ78727.1 helix-turn-helix domain-containing protein [Glutamicibacter sp. JL.03c]
MPTSQTLSRGIRVLEIVANSPVHLSIDEIAEKLEVHRSIAYRIIRTLEQHHLLNRDEAGHIRSASGLAVLARSVEHDLQAAATVELTTLANELSMTAFVAVWEYDLCTTLQSVSPLNSQRAIVHRPGSVHGMDVGAAGIAIQSHYSKDQWEAMDTTVAYREAAVQARSEGYATSENEVIQGVTSLAVPIEQPGQTPAALAVVFATSTVDSHEPVIEALKLAARRINRKLVG